MIGFMMFIFTIVAGVLVLVRGLQWIGRSPRSLEPPRDGGQGRAELERIEGALTRLEARVDDLQDQQRFLERLLARRQEDPALPPAAPREHRPSAEATEGEAAPSSKPDSILFDIGE